MIKAEKSKVLESLKTEVKEAKSATVVNYQGMNMNDMESLRQQVAKVGGTFGVVKNTLLRIALEETHGNTDAVKEGLEGPTALILAKEDEIAPLQALAKYLKDKELPKLKFGVFNNAFVDETALTTLSKLPAKNVLYGQLLGSLSGPAYGLVGVLNANLQMLVHILGQREKQLGANQG